MLQSSLDEYKPMLDALNEAGAQLVSLVDGPAVSAVNAVLNEDSDKYQAVAEVVQKRADKMKAQRQKSVEVSDCSIVVVVVVVVI